MNLITEPWLPVRLRDGSRQWISPLQLADPDVLAFDANRADFNGALVQFAVGLLQTTAPLTGPGHWRKLYGAPPDQATLTAWFLPVKSAFELDGDGPRFMQDFDLRTADGEALSVAGLFIEAPGENTLKNNTDHFIKRGGLRQLCRHCAALALFTLQVNAPGGGAGHRTGLRGGGPLTTLLLATHPSGAQPSLWQSLWLNVMQPERLAALGGDTTKDAPHHRFPWLASITALQAKDGQLTPIQVHPAHVYWAMPRRIRLNIDEPAQGVCDVCRRDSPALVTHYVTRNYGLNYKGGWRHPLSPYYKAKDEMLPLHPQPDGLGYRHWLGWVLGISSSTRHIEPAAVINDFLNTDNRKQRDSPELRLWAFGYDMDNMKPRCWYDSSMPLYSLADCEADRLIELRDAVSNWLGGADLAARATRQAVKEAWFTKDARGDLSFVDAAFWSATERGFYKLLQQQLEQTRLGQTIDPTPVAQLWLDALRRAALHLFDAELVGCGPIDRANPARVAAARRHLLNTLHGDAMKKALALPIATPAAAAKKKARATPSQPRSKGAP